MTASDSVSDEVKQADTPPSAKAPVQLFEERRPWVVVALGVALPGVYLAWWHAKVTEQLRLYGRCTENPRPTDANPVGAFLASAHGRVGAGRAGRCLPYAHGAPSAAL